MSPASSSPSPRSGRIAPPVCDSFRVLSITPAPRRPHAGGYVDAPLHILVMDADAAATAQLATRLYRRGQGVALAGDPREALALLQSTRFDLLVAHVEVPGRDGLAWIERLVSRPGRPEIALISNQASLPLAIRAANLPLAGYFPKPITDTALDHLIARVRARPHGR
jgi:two-component system, OmpR family, response regulator